MTDFFSTFGWGGEPICSPPLVEGGLQWETDLFSAFGGLQWGTELFRTFDWGGEPICYAPLVEVGNRCVFHLRMGPLRIV